MLRPAAAAEACIVIFDRQELIATATPFFHQVHEAFEDEYCHYIVFELAARGDLLEALKLKPDGFRERECRFLIREAVLGLQKLHERKLAMQDVSLENLLIFDYDGKYYIRCLSLRCTFKVFVFVLFILFYYVLTNTGSASRFAIRVRRCCFRRTKRVRSRRSRTRAWSENHFGHPNCPKKNPTSPPRSTPGASDGVLTYFLLHS